MQEHILIIKLKIGKEEDLCKGDIVERSKTFNSMWAIPLNSTTLTNLSQSVSNLLAQKPITNLSQSVSDLLAQTLSLHPEPKRLRPLGSNTLTNLLYKWMTSWLRNQKSKFVNRCSILK